jgi:phosphoglycolate phosphatase
MKSFDLLVFDLDGTLVDSSEDLTASVNYALVSLGFSAVSIETVKKLVGDGVSMLVKRALGENADDSFPLAMQLFMDYYDKHLLDKTTLYPDVLSFLNHFQTKKKVIATNKMKSFTSKIIDSLHLSDYFLDVLGEDSTPFKKPDPDLLRFIMAKWQAVPERTIVIGDGPNDVMLAQHAGAISCALLNGITARGQLLALAPDICCENLSELKDKIC